MKSKPNDRRAYFKNKHREARENMLCERCAEPLHPKDAPHVLCLGCRMIMAEKARTRRADVSHTISKPLVF